MVYTLVNATQKAVGLHCCKGALLSPVNFVEPILHSSHSAHKPVLVHGVIPLQLWGLTSCHVELHEVPVSLCLQSVEVPLNGSMILWYINHSQVWVIYKLAMGTLFPIVQIINQDVV